MAALLNECDGNQDGKVTQQEWAASKSGWEWLFSHIDENNDDQIDEKEYAGFQEFKKLNIDWQQKLKGTTR